MFFNIVVCLCVMSVHSMHTSLFQTILEEVMSYWLSKNPINFGSVSWVALAKLMSKSQTRHGRRATHNA